MKAGSIDDLERQVRADPDDIDLRVSLASAFRAAGRLLDAETTCRQALSRSPDHAGAKALLYKLEKARKAGTKRKKAAAARPPGVPDSRLEAMPPRAARHTFKGPPPAAAQVWPEDTLEHPEITIERPQVEAPQETPSPGDTLNERLPRNDTLDESAEPTDPDAELDARVAQTYVRLEGDDDPLELVRAFDRPFAEAISVLRSGGGAGGAGVSVFPELPDEALARLARGMTLCKFPKGQIILREGDTGSACYVIVAGTVRILKRDPLNPRGDFIEVNRLADGALFGEIALLADRRRHATVQAIEETSCYEIPRRLLRTLAAEYPAISPTLERFYRDRLLATLLATAPFFHPLEPERRAELLAHFEPRRVESGERIISEGQRAGGFFLIVLGSVDITREVQGGEDLQLATLGEGAYFGEMSLLRGDVAQASVTASAGAVELAMLPPKNFYTLVANNPILWETIRQEAHRRETELYQLVTGVTGSS